MLKTHLFILMVQAVKVDQLIRKLKVYQNLCLRRLQFDLKEIFSVVFHRSWFSWVSFLYFFQTFQENFHLKWYFKYIGLFFTRCEVLLPWFWPYILSETTKQTSHWWDHCFKTGHRDPRSCLKFIKVPIRLISNCSAEYN